MNKQKNTDELTQKTFKLVYESLPSNEKIKVRDRIIDECGISIAQIYKYLNNQSEPNKLVKFRIELILSEYDNSVNVNDLFPQMEKKQTA